MMDKMAVEAARASLAKAETSPQAMQAAKQCPELQTAWSDLLVASTRVYSKLQQGAKSIGKSNAWFGQKADERKNDALLTYIHHARNADEHGIKPITRHNPGSIIIQSTARPT
jgi:hypothetical protein